MIAVDLCPVIDEVNVRLCPNPRQGSGVAEGWLREAAKIDAHLPGGQVVEVHARNADGCCILIAVVRRLRVVAVVRHAQASLCEERGREGVGIVYAGTPSLLNTAASEAAIRRRSACKTAENRS